MYIHVWYYQCKVIYIIHTFFTHGKLFVKHCFYTLQYMVDRIHNNYALQVRPDYIYRNTSCFSVSSAIFSLPTCIWHTEESYPVK